MGMTRKEKYSMKLLKGTIIGKYYGSGDSPSVIFNDSIYDI
jgi:hypothetical protein